MAIKDLASGLIQRAALAFRAGLQFGGTRDLYAVFGYNTRPVFEDYLARYARQDIAGRIVDAPAQAVWRNPPEVKASAEFTSAWDKIVKKNNVWFNLERTDRLAGIGLYSTMLIGFDDTGNMEQPVSNPKEILYLQPYGQTSAGILKFEENPKSERYNKPTLYELKVADPSSLLNITGTTASTIPSTKNVKVIIVGSSTLRSPS